MMSNRELGGRKIYIVDNGLLNALIYKFSDNTGKLMEHAVMQELIRREHEVCFYKDKNEYDFIIQEGLIISQAIQVCYELKNEDTLELEVLGFVEACKAFGLSQDTGDR